MAFRIRWSADRGTVGGGAKERLPAGRDGVNGLSSASLSSTTGNGDSQEPQVSIYERSCLCPNMLSHPGPVSGPGEDV